MEKTKLIVLITALAISVITILQAATTPDFATEKNVKLNTEQVKLARAF